MNTTDRESIAERHRATEWYPFANSIWRDIFEVRCTAFKDRHGVVGDPKLLAEFDGLKANPPTIKTTYRGKAR